MHQMSIQYGTAEHCGHASLWCFEGASRNACYGGETCGSSCKRGRVLCRGHSSLPSGCSVVTFSYNIRCQCQQISRRHPAELECSQNIGALVNLDEWPHSSEVGFSCRERRAEEYFRACQLMCFVYACLYSRRIGSTK